MQKTETNIEQARKRDAALSDKALGGLSQLFDTKLMMNHFAEWLSDTLGVIESLEVYYVRYKPQTNCIVGYKLRTQSSSDAGLEMHCYAKTCSAIEYQSVERKSESKKWLALGNTAGVYLIPKLNTILYRYPNDATLAGPRSLDSTKRIQRTLYQHLSEYPEKDWRISDRKLSVVVVSYKPERRAVICIGSKATHRESGERLPLTVYARFYADQRGAKLYEQLRALHQGSADTGSLLTPEPICYLAEHRALLLREIQGETLDDIVDSAKYWSAIEMTGKALAELHKSKVKEYPSSSVDTLDSQAKQALLETKTYLCSILPEANQEIESLCMKLTQKINHAKAKLDLVHGDFHPGQVVCQSLRVGLIDFDRAHIGPTISDMANFIAHLRWRALSDASFDSTKLENHLIESYESVSGVAIDRSDLADWVANKLFLLAVGPFRKYENGWRSAVQELLSKCHRELR